MVEKEISQYCLNRAEQPVIEKQLTIEVGLHYIALIETSIESVSVSALELFTFQKIESNWYLIFQEVRLQSILFDLPYHTKQIFLNGFEQIIIPENLYSESAAQSSLELLFGWSNMEMNTDAITLPETNLYIACQIPQSLQQMLAGSFSDTPVYNSLRKQIQLAFQRATSFSNYWLIYFYPGSFSIVSIQQQQLQTAVHFSYTCADDVVYQIVALLNTYSKPVFELKVEISGIINETDEVYISIQKIIPDMQWQSVLPEQEILIEKHYYPEHYLLPFFNIIL
ncbi:MAG: DUF3822 family protein [Sphingobacteriales bacterium]|uniref:DUF3822 family protein n=1 Tax=Hydrotalea flava TaxID=714549 RepID=UPI0008379915|nr:DUF3822 family protein [Hydrotalea flava]RTL51984.1 MAG: DUF3822 family protein [Sphingobacteriales bacterium]